MARSKADGKLTWAGSTAVSIRDTDAHESASIDNAISGKVMFWGVSTLDQTVSVQFQGSFDGTTWEDIGAAMSLADGSTNATTDSDVLTDPWPKVRAEATAAVQPTEGTLTVWFSWVENT